MAYPAAEAL